MTLKKRKRKIIVNCNVNTNGTKIISVQSFIKETLATQEGKGTLCFLSPIIHMNYTKCLTFFHKMFKWQLLRLQYTIWAKAFEDNRLFCKGHIFIYSWMCSKGLLTKYKTFFIENKLCNNFKIKYKPKKLQWIL